MSKPLAFIILLGITALATGLFGALHNQLSYSVGSAYFHEFKFAQFGISPEWHNRVGASVVGWMASWWMGLVLGVPVFAFGYVLLRRTQYLSAGLAALALALIVALSGAMLGLVLGMIAPDYASGLPLPANVTTPDSFLRAALMHEGAYLGGAAGGLAALWSIWRARRLT